MDLTNFHAKSHLSLFPVNIHTYQIIYSFTQTKNFSPIGNSCRESQQLKIIFKIFAFLIGIGGISLILNYQQLLFQYLYFLKLTINTFDFFYQLHDNTIVSSIDLNSSEKFYLFLHTMAICFSLLCIYYIQNLLLLFL